MMKPDSLAMMMDPNSWPMLVLPVKRARESGFPELGVMLAGLGDREARPVVYLGGMFEPVSFRERATREYQTLAEVVGDGWEVD